MNLADITPCPESVPVPAVDPSLAITLASPDLGEAMARLNAFTAELLGGATATSALERWSGGQPVRVAEIDWTPAPISPTQRVRLQIEAEDPVVHRRVRLVCAGRDLVDGEIWYVPARLSPAIRERLQETDLSFGRAVASLQPFRRTLCARPTRLMAVSGADIEIAGPLLEHKAVVYTRAGLPIAEVREVFTPHLLPLLLEAER